MTDTLANLTAIRDAADRAIDAHLAAKAGSTLPLYAERDLLLAMEREFTVAADGLAEARADIEWELRIDGDGDPIDAEGNKLSEPRTVRLFDGSFLQVEAA